MNVHLSNLPKDLDTWDVTTSIASIPHSSKLGFAPQRIEGSVLRNINFKIRLNPNSAGGVGNNGTGTLTLPTRKIGRQFQDWVTKVAKGQEAPLKIKGKTVTFEFRPTWVPPKDEALTLDKTPFTDPAIEKDHEKELSFLSGKGFRINAVQFGVFFQREYPSSEKHREFSIESEGKDDTHGEAWLTIEYDTKCFRIMLGSSTDSVGSSIAIKFSSVEQTDVGYDLVPYICFDMSTPPILEKIEFYPEMSRKEQGKEQGTRWKSIHRLESVHKGHKLVAPYAHHLRLLIYEDASQDEVLAFKALCKVADPILADRILVLEGEQTVEASKQKFFEANRLRRLQKKISDLPWPIAFQLEALLHNGLLHTQDMDHGRTTERQGQNPK
ncbi:hypothetical protein H0H92_015101 [Tricholoma furcatifolium]|nr:hypothetical protein H0H92_015101 [Tricholoma furcatifolium]